MATLLRRVLNVQLLISLANTHNLNMAEYNRKILWRLGKLVVYTFKNLCKEGKIKIYLWLSLTKHVTETASFFVLILIFVSLCVLCSPMTYVQYLCT
jgi:hypothetical protein